LRLRRKVFLQHFYKFHQQQKVRPCSNQLELLGEPP
jgi:hypothetical protein